MTDPERTPEELEHIDQIRTLSSDLRTLGQRAMDESDQGAITTAEETLIQTFDLFTEARNAGVLP